MQEGAKTAGVVDYSFIETRGLMRSRARTVAMLVGVSVASSLLVNHGVEEDAINAMPLLLYLGLAVLGMFLHIGFLRTVVLGERREMGPLGLLREGKRFVLRIYGFYAGAIVALAILAIPLYILIPAMVELSDDAALRVVTFVLVMLFCRVLVFGPLMIIFLDRNIIDAVRAVRSVRYKELPHIFILLFTSWGLSAVIPNEAMQGNIIFNALMAMMYGLIRIAIDLGGLRVLLYKRQME